MTDESAGRSADRSSTQDHEPMETRLLDLAEKGRRTDGLVREHPEVLTAVVDGLLQIDTAAFVAEHPEAADQLLELLWDGLRIAAVEADLDGVTDHVTVSFAADDCSLVGHLDIDGEAGTIASGTDRATDSDVTISGPADVLVGLLAGDVDPKLGFMRGRFTIDGSTETAMALVPVLDSLSKQLPV
ncbi:SCP2 sterol-binding domain-containing protein [Halococcus sp. PRR34]|uniref:SCP2 sterol-binding domain-containing protein n=1 Tax=Halococcus sp. PRR34 TaxID=3020830 RepID=UPI00235FD131|nr:SCP2 sterol-binding domain-containing protein [Halococcus sp. PRR34]